MAEIQQICYYSIDLTNTKWTNLAFLIEQSP